MGHREWIGGRALTLLSHYWRDDDPVELTAAIGADWADVLEGLPREYIQRACVQYMRDEPNRKPKPGAIYQIARKLMPKPAHVQPEGPARRSVFDMTEEELEQRRKEAAEIMARFRGVGA